MKHLNLTDELYQYLLDVSLHEDQTLLALREKTSKHKLAIMQTAPEQAQFMQFLLKLIGAKRVLELGTYTGYATLAMAQALPEDGQVITCDINDEWTSIGKPYWEASGEAHKISLKLGKALDTIDKLLQEKAVFDFIFIDADKTNYIPYYEAALQLLSPQGMIAIDNTLWEGRVIDPSDTGGQTREIRKLNLLLKEDKRVHISLLPIGDGLTLVKPKTAI